MATTIHSSALDFNNIKNNLKTYLANKDQFRDYNFEASGLSNILDVLAYNTHVNALIANFALNESFLGTAQLRSSIVSLAEGIGYIPDTVTSSVAKLRIFFTTTVTPREDRIVLPAYTKFTTTVDDVTYTFQTIEAYYAVDDGTGFYEFKTATGSNQIPVYEGSLRTKTFLVGEYEDNPVYIIPDNTIDSATVSVNVYENVSSTSGTPYQNILNATSISSQSTVYILKESPNGFYELSFGDGVTFGVAPAAGNKIVVSYLSSAGASANGATVFAPSASYTSGSITATLRTTLIQKSVGGKEQESIESIRQNAPFQYASQNRMVTAQDYSALILKNYSNFIQDIISWGGEDALNPEYGAVYSSVLFNDDVSVETIDEIKLNILAIAKQLAVASFNLRFEDPITTYVELETYYQFNPRLTDLTINNVNDLIRTTVSNYFTANTGRFAQSFRRSTMLSLIDDVSTAVLSSRANVRMQRRFVPTTPNLISVINNNTLGSLTDNQLNTILNFVISKKFDEAANYIINNNLAAGKTFTELRTVLSSTRLSINQALRYPVAIAVPDDVNYTITSSQFIYRGVICEIRNRLNSNILQIVQVAGNNVLLDNIGSYNAVTGVVTVNYFNPTSIVGGSTYIKLSAVPANPSAITPTRNERLVYDPDRSSTTAVITTANN